MAITSRQNTILLLQGDALTDQLYEDKLQATMTYAKKEMFHDTGTVCGNSRSCFPLSVRCCSYIFHTFVIRPDHICIEANPAGTGPRKQLLHSTSPFRSQTHRGRNFTAISFLLTKRIWDCIMTNY